MIKITKKQNCSGGHSCSNVCHNNCINMIENNEGFLYPKVFKMYRTELEKKYGYTTKTNPFREKFFKDLDKNEYSITKYALR